MGHAILERVLLFGTRSADYIRASGHNGCIATEVTLQATTEAEYMTAPERFADSQIPLAPRAPSIHDPSNPQRFWVTSSQVTGAGGRVYRSDSGGGSWVNCTTGLPNIPINSVVVDPANFKRIWVAADVGVYQTLDLGSSWAAFSNGLPNAMVVDLLFHKQDRRLFCGTRNRGAWVILVP